MSTSQQIAVLAKALSVADGIDPGFNAPSDRYYAKAQGIVAALKVVGDYRIAA